MQNINAEYGLTPLTASQMKEVEGGLWELLLGIIIGAAIGAGASYLASSDSECSASASNGDTCTCTGGGGGGSGTYLLY